MLLTLSPPQSGRWSQGDGDGNLHGHPYKCPCQEARHFISIVCLTATLRVKTCVCFTGEERRLKNLRDLPQATCIHVNLLRSAWLEKPHSCPLHYQVQFPSLPPSGQAHNLAAPGTFDLPFAVCLLFPSKSLQFLYCSVLFPVFLILKVLKAPVGSRLLLDAKCREWR